MCHVSMKLSDKFDPNQMYTLTNSGKTRFCERNTQSEFLAIHSICRSRSTEGQQ